MRAYVRTSDTIQVGNRHGEAVIGIFGFSALGTVQWLSLPERGRISRHHPEVFEPLHQHSIPAGKSLSLHLEMAAMRLRRL